MCANEEHKNAQHGAIAKAYDSYLYQKNIEPKTNYTNPADSINHLNHQINNWLISNIIKEKSATQLPADVRKDIEEKVKKYEQELYDFAYKSEIIRQKMDTAIVDTIISQYYDKYISNYLLDEAYVRFVYVKCDKKQYVKEVEEWMKDSIDLYNLEDFCKEELQECHLYPNKWVAMRKFQSKLTGADLDISKVKNGQTFFKIKKDKVHYLINILEFKDQGTPAPLSFVRDDIKSILLNKKKTEFINTFLNDLLKSEMDKGNVKIIEQE